MSDPNHQTPGGLKPEELLRAGAAPDSYGPEGSGSGDVNAEAIAVDFPDLEILELLGRGGMGVVFKARDRKLKRIVALKVMGERLSAEPRFVERFQREGEALARLHHPNIVTLFDFGRAGSRCYMVMEFVDGLNLRALIRSGVSPAEALALVPQICAALQYAHEHGIVHRDIKPENILVDVKGCIKVADFGLAKLLPTADQQAPAVSQTIIGTPAYMAPEQIENPAKVDHRADVYALGVVFYELLTGQLPIGLYQPPSERVHVDVRLDAVVLRALQRRPELRYQSAAAVGTHVDDIRRTPPPPARRRWLPTRRRIAMVAGGLAALILAAMMFMGYFEINVQLPGSGGFEYTLVPGAAEPEVKAAVARLREIAIEYPVDKTAVVPGKPWVLPSAQRTLERLPDEWPRIIGPLTLDYRSPALFRILDEKARYSASLKASGLIALRDSIGNSIELGRYYTTLLALKGVQEEGFIRSNTYSIVMVCGNLDGTIISNSYGTVIVEGDLNGTLTSTSYLAAVITGNLNGTLTSHSHAIVYLMGGVKGDVVLTDSRLYIHKYTTAEDLKRISGKGEVYLAESDLAPGLHEIGTLKVTVGRTRSTTP